MSAGFTRQRNRRPAPFRRRAAALARGFRGDAAGAIAVEFAVLAPLMFALIFLVFEISWRYYVQSSAETAVAALASRLADPASRVSDVDAVKQQLCASARVLPCGRNDSGFRVQVVELTPFAPAVTAPVQDRIAIAPRRPNVIRVIHEHASVAPTGAMKTLGMSAPPVLVTAAFWAR